MNHPILLRCAALAAALGACGVPAQTRPAGADAGLPPPVLTDAGPAPAQERDSMGAIVLENSPVRAQRRAFERASARNALVGRSVQRATSRAQRRAELAQARQEQTVELYRHGAAALIEN
jgi:hypothetical protein